MSTIPINPKVLEWARTHRQLSLDQAADLLEITVDELRAYEDGSRAVNLAFLNKVAKKYNLPLASLAMPEPLPPPAPLKDFRTFKGKPPTVSNETALAIDVVRSHMEFLSDLVEEDPELFRPLHLRRIPFSKDEVSGFAAAERSHLNVSVVEQLSWRDYLEAFRALRRRIEKLGIFVHLLKMPTTDCRGFSLVHGERIALIVISDREETYQAKIFTLLHEYGHLLLRKGGLCDENRENSTERFCNLFAAHFLMPRKVLSRALDLESYNLPREWSLPEVADAAKHIKVSQEALAIHLQDLGLAPPGYYERWRAKLPEKHPARPGFGRSSYAERRVRSWGVEYTGVVMKALDKSRINRVDAYEMLRLKPGHFSEVRKILRKLA